MNVLAFDTVTESLSFALLCGEQHFTRQLLPGIGHGRILLSEAESLLAEAGLQIADVDVFGVGVGPGSFTGVRIGVSAAQAMAFAHAKPVLGISSLAAMCLSKDVRDYPARTNSRMNAGGVLAVIDARMGEIYVGYYDISASDEKELSVRACSAEMVIPLSQIGASRSSISDSPSLWDTSNHTLAVAGWDRIGDGLMDALSDWSPARVVEGAYPCALAIARLARHRHLEGEHSDPLALLPSYVRSNVAKLPLRR